MFILKWFFLVLTQILVIVESFIDNVEVAELRSGVNRSNDDSSMSYFGMQIAWIMEKLKMVLTSIEQLIMWITKWLDKILGKNVPNIRNIKDPPQINFTKIEVGKSPNKIIIKENYYFLSNEKDTWYSASAKCIASGMRPVSLLSEQELLHLNQVIRTHPSLMGKFMEDFWMGGIFMDLKNAENSEESEDSESSEDSEEYYDDDDVAFDYVWYPSGKLFSFTQWDNYHPLNETKPCVKYRFCLTGSAWRSEECAKRLRYICQKIQ